MLLKDHSGVNDLLWWHLAPSEAGLYQRLYGFLNNFYIEDANGETRTRNPWITNPVL